MSGTPELPSGSKADTMEALQRDDPGIELMLAWQAGEEGAFDRLVELYSGRLYALFTRFLGAVPYREDLVQEAFLRLFKARDRYRPTARFSTFLYRIAFNLATNERGRAHLRLVRSLPGSAGSGTGEGAETDGAPADPVDERAPQPDAGMMRDDVVQAVRAAIADLPETQRMALVLAKYEGLAYDDIAEVLGSTEKAIKSLIHRARETLRLRLAPLLQEEMA